MQAKEIAYYPSKTE